MDLFGSEFELGFRFDCHWFSPSSLPWPLLLLLARTSQAPGILRRPYQLPSAASTAGHRRASIPFPHLATRNRGALDWVQLLPNANATAARDAVATVAVAVTITSSLSLALPARWGFGVWVWGFQVSGVGKWQRGCVEKRGKSGNLMENSE